MFIISAISNSVSLNFLLRLKLVKVEAPSLSELELAKRMELDTITSCCLLLQIIALCNKAEINQGNMGRYPEF